MSRRWYFVAVGLLATVALGFAASIVAPVQYAGTSNVLLLPPLPKGNPTGANPYLGLAGYEPFADVVSRAMTDDTNVAKLKAAGVTDPFTADPDPTTTGPVLLVTVTGNDSARTLTELRTILAGIPALLTDLQDTQSVPATDRFTAQTITAPEHPATVRKSQIRAILVGVAAGLFLTALGTSLLDALIVRRRARRRIAAAKARRAESMPDEVPGSLSAAASAADVATDVLAEPAAPAEPARGRRIGGRLVAQTTGARTLTVAGSATASKQQPSRERTSGAPRSSSRG